MRTLYHTPLSPYCRKIRLLLAEKRLQFELTQENVWDRRLEFFELNPAGEVPVLVEDNGTVISGNYAITEYIEEKHPSPAMLGKTTDERIEIRRLVDWFDHKFDREVTQNLVFEKVFKRLFRYGSPNTEAMRAGRKNVQYHLEYVGYLLQDHPWLAGDVMTLADLAAGAHVSAVDYLGDIDWQHHPRVREWYAILKSRPSFRVILCDRVLGITPPDYYENPDF
jgi:glutathione S-transferase